jgi:Putative sensor
MTPTRLRLYRNPLRLAVSSSTWRSAWFLLSYLVMGWALFAAVFAATTAAAILALTLAGLPVLIAAAAVIRGCANAERWRQGVVTAEPVRGGYRGATGAGVMAQVRTRWHDPATWRDLACLAGLFVPLWVLDLAVSVVWLVLIAGITLPAWYWAPESTYPGGAHHGVQLGYFPDGPHGHTAVGLYVDTLPKALLAAGGFLVLFLLFNYVLVVTARAHATVARSLLRAPRDPLAAAKGVLSRSGPLQSQLPHVG